MNFVDELPKDDDGDQYVLHIYIMSVTVKFLRFSTE